jgi:hypothetical protein
MFFEVLSFTYHILITIDSLTYPVLLGTLQYPFLMRIAGPVRTGHRLGLSYRRWADSCTS